ncbi:response regulator [Chryseobacterium carnipullorum]|uniref:Response regulator n=1 Tax=Chryseobacterium carnipullorum TaxID=1124835 RepID=A0A376EFV0_CHRCU|nr:response regulator [Chryseobacterium carnipullorum]AZA46960.1 response regulator [Chryseobacterium carnipullorum]AZA66313.1 response regulator [Chryseobacterium carnipullorum]STD07032.1 Response regulator receiver domain [Chryseobacterium carnipullorum]HBV16340.1 response regulator [Chryseobacterium carnipullorum]
MNKEYLNVIAADNDEGNIIFFKNIFKDLRIGVKSQCFSSGEDLMEYLTSEGTIIPEVVFIKYDIPGKNSMECLDEIKTDSRLSNIIIVIYSDQISESEIEEIFVNGGNIVMRKPDSYDGLKKSLTEIITINWQYHTSGLNKDNFIMKV